MSVFSGGDCHFLSTQSKKREVIAFLAELNDFLGKADCDIDSDLTIIKKKKSNDEDHSTPYTLLDLDYDVWDVVERLKGMNRGGGLWRLAHSFEKYI